MLAILRTSTPTQLANAIQIMKRKICSFSRALDLNHSLHIWALWQAGCHVMQFGVSQSVPASPVPAQMAPNVSVISYDDDGRARTYQTIREQTLIQRHLSRFDGRR